MSQPIGVEVGARVRCKKLFLHWKQIPGTVVEVDRYFGLAKVEFDNGVTNWVARSVLEVGQTVTVRD